MKKSKKFLFLLMELIIMFIYNSEVYAAPFDEIMIEGGGSSGSSITNKTTTCVYSASYGSNEFKITFIVYPNSTGGVTIKDTQFDTSNTNYRLEQSYINSQNFVLEDKLSCPSSLQYSIGNSLYDPTIWISFDEMDNALHVQDPPMMLVGSNNNNQSLNTETKVTLIRSCNVDAFGNMDDNLGKINIETYSDGSIKTNFSNNIDSYKVKLDSSITYKDFTSSCPKLSAKCDYWNDKTCTITKGGQSSTESSTGDDIDSNSGAEYTCTYNGQIDNKQLKIYKYKDKWIVSYPNGDTKTIALNSVGSNLFPSSDCEDIFYSEDKNTIKKVKENQKYTNVHVSQYCGQYSDMEQFCSTDSGCKITNVPCGSESETNQYGDCPDEIAPLILFIKKVVFNTLQIFVPIILIIMATIDLVRAVMASDDKVMKDATSRIIRRVLTAVLMFFVTTIVVIVTDMFATSGVGEYNEWKACWQELD